VGPREFHDTIPSSQDRAIELARNGCAEGTRVVAAQQTRGRGRLDHRWESPDGGLYLSIVLRAPAEQVSWLPLSLGARLARALSDRYRLALRVKWPNDLLLLSPDRPARKLGGIVVDRVPVADGQFVEVAGIGVNVGPLDDRIPAELHGRVAALGEVVRPAPPLGEVEAIAVECAMRASIGLRGAGGVEATQRLCGRWLYGVGRSATIDGTTTGTIAGLGDSGELLIDRAGHRLPIRAGDVRVEGVA
jgi:BirA family transcriptional regulator, biotin operon repressor / biotin---[acetyl-CoA-carboxylase] ligase